MPDLNTELQAMLSQSFDIAWPEFISKEQIIGMLAIRLEQLIAGTPDQLFSLLYRLDISEQKIKEAMHSNESVTHKLAALIYERQLEKIVSRKKFRNEKPDNDLAW